MSVVSMHSTVERARTPRERAFRWLVSGIWLFYLVNPVRELLEHASGWRQVVGLAAVAPFVVLYLADIQTSRGFRSGPAGRQDLVKAWGFLVGMLACVAVVVPGAGDESLTFLVFVSAAAMGTLPLPLGIGLVAGLFALTELSGWLVPGWSANGNGLAIFLAALAVFGFRMAFLRQQQLVAAERELGERALEEERSRIARDLHDILGHSLTVITVKSELAGRLLDVDTDRARAELDELERLARDALADVRATALGVRGISLPGEIAAARNALETAGIESELPTVAEEVPTRWRELFAWTVREGVTNVIRHSVATRCEITMDEHRVTVSDDGVGGTADVASGHGLDGLRQRARLAGATLTTGPAASGEGFSIRVEAAE